MNSGKVLRMTPTGGIPSDNPFPGSRIYSYGHRNSFGLAFDPKTRDLWETENGPECNDELNRIHPGPQLRLGPVGELPGSGAPGHERRRPEAGPAAAVLPDDDRSDRDRLLRRCDLGTAREGDLFFGAFNTGDIHEVSLNADRTTAVKDTTPFNHGNLVLSIERGPDGTLYFSDGVGIFKLVLAR